MKISTLIKPEHLTVRFRTLFIILYCSKRYLQGLSRIGTSIDRFLKLLYVPQLSKNSAEKPLEKQVIFAD
jgi:hypothetical protein